MHGQQNIKKNNISSVSHSFEYKKCIKAIKCVPASSSDWEVFIQ